MKQIPDGLKPKFSKVNSTRLTKKVQRVLLNNQNITVRYPLEHLANLCSLEFQKLFNSKLTDTNSLTVKKIISPTIVDTVPDLIICT